MEHKTWPVSPSGEMAISLGARPGGAFTTTGTLARSSLAGGSQGGDAQRMDGHVGIEVEGFDVAPDPLFYPSGCQP